MAEEDKAAVDPVDVTPDPVPEPKPEIKPVFDPSIELPEDVVPDSLREALKGKSTKDLVDLYSKSREYVSSLGAKNKELEGKLSQAGEKRGFEDLSDEEKEQQVLEYARQNLVQKFDYDEVFSGYRETGEIPEAFIKEVEAKGIRVGGDDIEDFLLWRKERYDERLEHMGAATEGQLEGEELEGWLTSEQCPLDRDMRRGFYKQAREGDYSWVALAAKKYQEWLEGGGQAPPRGRGAGRFAQGPVRRGRAPLPKPGEGDLSYEEFESEVLKVRNMQKSGEISKADAIRKERALVERRRRTKGEKT